MHSESRTVGWEKELEQRKEEQLFWDEIMVLALFRSSCRPCVGGLAESHKACVISSLWLVHKFHFSTRLEYSSGDQFLMTMSTSLQLFKYPRLNGHVVYSQASYPNTTGYVHSVLWSFVAYLRLELPRYMEVLQHGETCATVLTVIRYCKTF